MCHSWGEIQLKSQFLASSSIQSRNMWNKRCFFFKMQMLLHCSADKIADLNDHTQGWHNYSSDLSKKLWETILNVNIDTKYRRKTGWNNRNKHQANSASWCTCWICLNISGLCKMAWLDLKQLINTAFNNAKRHFLDTHVSIIQSLNVGHVCGHKSRNN